MSKPRVIGYSESGWPIYDPESLKDLGDPLVDSFDPAWEELAHNTFRKNKHQKDSSVRDAPTRPQQSSRPMRPTQATETPEAPAPTPEPPKKNPFRY